MDRVDGPRQRGTGSFPRRFWPFALLHSKDERPDEIVMWIGISGRRRSQEGQRDPSGSSEKVEILRSKIRPELARALEGEKGLKCFVFGFASIERWRHLASSFGAAPPSPPGGCRPQTPGLQTKNINMEVRRCHVEISEPFE